MNVTYLTPYPQTCVCETHSCECYEDAERPPPLTAQAPHMRPLLQREREGGREGGKGRGGGERRGRDIWGRFNFIDILENIFVHSSWDLVAKMLANFTLSSS